MRFKVFGKLKSKNEKQFSRQVEAESKNMAMHKIYSFFGNVYKLPKRKIVIEKIEELK